MKLLHLFCHTADSQELSAYLPLFWQFREEIWASARLSMACLPDSSSVYLPIGALLHCWETETFRVSDGKDSDLRIFRIGGSLFSGKCFWSAVDILSGRIVESPRWPWSKLERKTFGPLYRTARQASAEYAVLLNYGSEAASWTELKQAVDSWTQQKPSENAQIFKSRT